MYFLGLGLTLLAMKALAWGAVATWPWWSVLVPFGMAVLWWAWADGSGYTRRCIARRERRRQQARIERHLAQQGRPGTRHRAQVLPSFGVTVQ